MDFVELPKGVHVAPTDTAAKLFAVLTVASADSVASAIYEADRDGFKCDWVPEPAEGEEVGSMGSLVYIVNYKGHSRWTWTVDPVAWSVHYVG